MHRRVSWLKGAARAQEQEGVQLMRRCQRQKEKAALILKALIRQQGMKSRGAGSEAFNVGRRTFRDSSIQGKRIKYHNIGYRRDGEQMTLMLTSRLVIYSVFLWILCLIVERVKLINDQPTARFHHPWTFTFDLISFTSSLSEGCVYVWVFPKS